jgi:hypothetical protein
MMLRFLQDAVDPRQKLIPKPPPVNGDLPDAEVPTADIGTFETGNFFSELWTSIFGGNELWAWLFSAAGIGGILSYLWSIYTFFAYLISLILIVLYIYATIRKEHYDGLIEQGLRDAEKIWDETYRRATTDTSRLTDIRQHIDSDNPNDWKLSIIEADIILDQTLKERGYAGNTLGERLRSITPNQLGSVDDAWTAHRVRNKIAHEGADFVLTKRMAEETIARYMNVFREFGVQ